MVVFAVVRAAAAETALQSVAGIDEVGVDNDHVVGRWCCLVVVFLLRVVVRLMAATAAAVTADDAAATTAEAQVLGAVAVAQLHRRRCRNAGVRRRSTSSTGLRCAILLFGPTNLVASYHPRRKRRSFFIIVLAGAALDVVRRRCRHLFLLFSRHLVHLHPVQTHGVVVSVVVVVSLFSVPSRVFLFCGGRSLTHTHTDTKISLWM